MAYAIQVPEGKTVATGTVAECTTAAQAAVVNGDADQVHVVDERRGLVYQAGPALRNIGEHDKEREAKAQETREQHRAAVAANDAARAKAKAEKAATKAAEEAERADKAAVAAEGKAATAAKLAEKPAKKKAAKKKTAKAAAD